MDLSLLSLPLNVNEKKWQKRWGQVLHSRMSQQMHIIKQLAQTGLCRFQIIRRLQIKPVLR